MEMKNQLNAIARLLNYIEIEGDVVDDYWLDDTGDDPMCASAEGMQTDLFKKLIKDARKALHTLETISTIQIKSKRK
jgi:hypothetical protein